MQIEEVVVVLDELARQARDDEAVYRTAAVDADELALTALSVNRAVQCRERAEELEGIAILYRRGPRPLNYYVAPFARTMAWIATSLKRRDDREIVDTCKRHDDAARDAYEQVLSLALPVNLRLALRNHLATMREGGAGLAHLRRAIHNRVNRCEARASQHSISAFGD